MLTASLLYALSAYEGFHRKALLLYSGGETCICVSNGPPLTTRGDRGKGVRVGKIFFEHIIFFILQMKDCLSIVKQGSQMGKWEMLLVFGSIGLKSSEVLCPAPSLGFSFQFSTHRSLYILHKWSSSDTFSTSVSAGPRHRRYGCMSARGVWGQLCV